MKKIQRGFTLIELVMVIVILGILAAVAIPKFVDLSSDAKLAAAAGIAGSLSSAAAINYAGCAAKGQVATSNVCVTITKCSETGNLTTPAVTITPGAIPGTTTKGTVYITVANDTSVTSVGAKNGTSAQCTATYGDGAGGTAMTFTAIGAGNP